MSPASAQIRLNNGKCTKPSHLSSDPSMSRMFLNIRLLSLSRRQYQLEEELLSAWIVHADQMTHGLRGTGEI